MYIKSDDVFIYPTDTVWGIGCSLYSEKGHARISEIKKTSINKPLSVMFTSVEDIFNNFNFPSEITLAWLIEFFKLETTLGYPAKTSKLKFPKWATGDSDYISIRFLETVIVKNIYNDIHVPFFSTSLNITGSNPIISTEEALSFQKKYASDALFFGENQINDLSGTSSTIVFLNENLDFEIKREGRRVEDVKKLLINLFNH
ncbi:MAG: Sua5/YciO/YrdC/YwlC family protein [Bacteriovorax sp.]|nr:Sua5/YciO/YrdC/YwlC family protein [Bacteriovorax sp.]